MAPHRIFGIPEILAEIMTYVDTGRACRQKWLLWIALSCKAFSSHALDILWVELESLLPLLKLLPGFQEVDGVWVSIANLPLPILLSS
jgi:hypothetical protein